MKISIVIPTKNEHGNIDRLIKRINTVVKEYNIESEILVIDDNSKDGTQEDILTLMKVQNNLRLIQRSNYRNWFPKYPKKWNYLGIGSAHKIGYNLAEGDLIISVDGDLSHPPEKIPILIDKIKNGYDISVGSRYVKGGGSDKNLINRFVSRMGSTYLAFMCGVKIRDFSTGMRAIKKEVWEKIKSHEYTNDNNFLIESLYFAHKNDARIIEIPIFFKEREIGESKTPLVKETLKALILPLKLKLSSYKRI